jgi:ribonuclease-3
MTNLPDRIDQLQAELGKKIRVNFKNKKLLVEAFTHRSYLNEHRGIKLSSNERLEFLGDSILQFWVSKTLYNTYPDLPEGVLTNMRTWLVRTETLAKIAEELCLGDYLLLSRGEEKGGGRKNKALLANTFEALLGAIFLNNDLSAAENFLTAQFRKFIDNLKQGESLKDAKSLLQERIQTKIKFSPEYKVLSEEGPDHDKTFEIGVLSEGKIIGRGKGKSKQEAEENAAKNALEKITNLD